MRAELEQVALIEQYLLNKMTAEEKASFESKMASDEALKNETDAQEKVMNAIKRVGLKTAAVSAYSAWRFRKWLMRSAIIALILGGGYTAFYFITQEKEEDCVPCEDYYENTSNGGHSEAAAMPDNCCDFTPAESSGPLGNTESPGHNLGFEIVFDTCSLEDEAYTDEGNPDILNVVETSSEHRSENNGNHVTTVVDNSDELLNSSTYHSENESFTDNRIGRLDTIYSDNGSSDEPAEKIKHPGFNTKTFKPRDSFLDSLQQRDDYNNGNVSQEPAFPGGQEALQRYLSSNMHYPLSAVEERIQGTVYVTFVIDKNGKIKDTKVIKGVHRILDREAEKVVSNMPDWIPGKVNGVKTDLRYTIPVNFVLSGNMSKSLNDSLTRDKVMIDEKPLNSEIKNQSMEVDFQNEGVMEIYESDTSKVMIESRKGRRFRKKPKVL